MKTAILLSLWMVFWISGCKSPTRTVVEEALLFDYIVMDDKIITTPVENIEPFSSCTETADLQLTYLQAPDTLTFSREGSELKLVEDEISGGLILFSGFIHFFESEDLVVQLQRVYIGGTNASLSGRWLFQRFQYEVVSGSGTELDLEVLEEDAQGLTDFYIVPDLEITAKTWRELPRFEDLALADMQGFQEFLVFYYGGGVVLNTGSNPLTMELLGFQNQEIVTVERRLNGDFLWTSSNSAHGDHHFYENPTQCPNPFYPSWWQTFLEENLSGSAKVGDGSEPSPNWHPGEKRDRSLLKALK